MKKFIYELEHDYIVYLISILGICFIIFPDTLQDYASILLGFALLVYTIVGLIDYFKYHDKEVKVGTLVVYIVLILALFHQKGTSLHTIGVIWAVISLQSVAEEIDEFIEKKEFSIIRCIMIIISLGLAILLLFDPEEHFSSHLQILGLEVIASMFARKHKRVE